jgi:hypothetical protein
MTSYNEGLPVALANVTGAYDNSIDIVASGERGVTVYPNNGDGTFGAPVLTVVSSPSWLAIADVDGDNSPELLAVFNGVASEWKFFGPQLGYVQSFSLGGGNIATSVTIGDANGDGAPDLLIGYINPNTGCVTGHCAGLKIFFGNNHGSFKRYDAIWASSTNGFTDPQAIVADVNNDGINDIVGLYANSNTGIFTMLGLGGGKFSPPQVFSGNTARSATIAYGDLNHDGKMDIITGSHPLEAGEPGTFGIWLNTTPVPSRACPQPSSLGETICTPPADSTQTSSSLRVKAAGLPLWPVELSRLWLDGAKVATANSAHIDRMLNVVPGYHRLAAEVFDYSSVESNSPSEKAVLYFLEPCPGQSAAKDGINVCTPQSGATYASPVKVQAFVYSPTHNIYRFDLWVDGVKKLSVGSTGIMNGSIALSSGKHNFDFVYRDNNGNRTVKTVYATVQ